jgi:hypothetical protein
MVTKMMMIMKVFYNRILSIARLFIQMKVVENTTFIARIRAISPVKISYTGIKLDHRRHYSTNSLKSKFAHYYANSDVLKVRILKDNRNKSGIYMWTNLVNKKRYVGSSVDLKRRFLEYFNVNRLLRETSMMINRALVKRGFYKFSLTILEYCEVNQLMEREKYYFNLLNPEYNRFFFFIKKLYYILYI